jgi:hypothetical protein
MLTGGDLLGGDGRGDALASHSDALTPTSAYASCPLGGDGEPLRCKQNDESDVHQPRILLEYCFSFLFFRVFWRFSPMGVQRHYKKRDMTKWDWLRN